MVAAQDLSTGEFFSLKRNRKDAVFDKVYKECNILAQLGDHDNVIRLLGGVVDHEAKTALQPSKVCKIMLEYSGCKLIYNNRAAFRILFGGARGEGKIAIYILHGGQPPNYTSKVYHNLGESRGAPPGIFF